MNKKIKKILIFIVILAIAAGGFFFYALQQAKLTKCEAIATLIARGMDQYQSDFSNMNGAYPPEKDESMVIYLDGDSSNGGPDKMFFLPEGLAEKKGLFILDPWGNPFHYRTTNPSNPTSKGNKRPFIWSNGPNGKDENGEGDDIKSW